MADQPSEAPQEVSFAEMLEAFSPGGRSEVRVGEKVKGKVISIGKDTVFVDAGMKIDAVVDRGELLDAEQQLTCAEGDELELYVSSVSEHEVRLSRALSGVGGAELLQEAYRQGTPVEGKVKETCKGGFQVEVMQRRAFCPISQIDIGPVPDPNAHVGATYQFLISRFEHRGRNIVVSRRALLDREQEAVRKEFLETLQKDTVLDGTVARVLPFGAFVTIAPGLEGMVHVSEMSWSRTASAEEMLKPGDRLRVKVIGIDTSGGPKKTKIALSLRQLEEDPWLTVEERFKPGDAVRGKVTRCADFGAFVEIAPGVEGMIHISELSYTQRVNRVEDVAAPGDAVTAVIKSVEADRKRISLSLRDAEGDPWAEVLERFPVGRRVEGVIEKKEKFGFFVSLSPGITGLLPMSNIRKASSAADLERAKPGDTVAVAVEEVNLQRRRISLTPAGSEEDGEWHRFSAASGSGDLGEMAEKLRNALSSKMNRK